MKKILITALIPILSVSFLISVISPDESLSTVVDITCPDSLSIDPENVFDFPSGFYLIQASEFFQENETTNDVCLIRAVDFDMGPLVGADGDTLTDSGRTIYPFSNGCSMTDDTVITEQDSDGNITNIDTIQFVVCESTLAVCESELGLIEMIVLETDDNDQIVDMCRVQLSLGVANIDTMTMDTMMMVDTMMMDTMMTMDTMVVDSMMTMDTMMMTDTLVVVDTMMTMDTMSTGGGTVVFGTGAMPCSLENNQISIRSTFQDTELTSNVETPLMDDQVAIVNIGGTPEFISASTIWDIDISHQTISFTWNSTDGIDARTIRGGQFYRFYVDFGTAINQITDANIAPESEGNPVIDVIGDNLMLVQWEPGSSIGPTFNTRIILDLDSCDRIEDQIDPPGGGGVDTMVVTPPASDQVDTSVDCDDFPAFNFELTSLSDSSFNVTETFIETETRPILSFSFDDVSFTTDTVLQIDSMIRLDSTYVVDSMLVIDTSVVINTTLTIDTTITGLETVQIIDTMTVSDTTIMIEMINFNVTTSTISDTTITTTQNIIGIDSTVNTETIVNIDSVFMNQTQITFDTTTITDPITGIETIEIDSLETTVEVFVSLDTTTIVNMETVFDTMFMIDTMLMIEELMVFDTMFDLDTTFTVMTSVNIDTSFVFQNAFEFDTTFMFDTVTVIGPIMVPDSVLVFQNILTGVDSATVINTQTVIDTLFDIDTLITIEEVQIIDSVLQVNMVNTFDTIPVETTVFTFDTLAVIRDTLYNADSTMIVGFDTIAFALDTMAMLDTVFVVDTMSMLDSMFVTTITTGIDTVFTFDQTLIGFDTMVVTDTLFVIDSTFTLMQILRENGMFLVDEVLTVDSALVVVTDYNTMNGDTICGNLVMDPIIGLNSLTYTLSWNTNEYELLSCRNGDLPLFNCEATELDPIGGTIRGSQDSISVTLDAQTVLAEYCVVVRDDSIDSPNAIQIEETYNNARTQVDRDLISVSTGISLSDFGLTETETLVDASTNTAFIVNRCLVYGTNFDLGQVSVAGESMAYRYAVGCQPDGTNAESLPYQVCRSSLELCCEDLGTKDVVLLSFTSEGIINTCRFPLTVSDDQRFCNPIRTFECIGEQSMTTNDIVNNNDGTFSIGLDAFGLGGSADHCIIKTIDYQAGPIRLNNGSLVILDGRVAYNAAGCTFDDSFIEEIRDQNGNLVEQRSFNYVLCDDQLDFCCEDFDELELTIVTQPINGTVVTDFCPVSLDILDSQLSISCSPIQVSCIDDVNDESLRPDVVSSGLCSVSQDLLFVDDLTGLDTCGIGVISRTWYIDEDLNGLTDTDVTCVQFITVAATESFNPINIRWPVSRMNTLASGLILTCSDSINTSSAVSDSINIGGPLFCSSSDEFGDVSWCDAACSLVGYSQETTTIASPSSGCAELRILHTVIDWCTYSSMGRPDDNPTDIDPGNFEVISDQRDGCQDCGADGPATYMRYRADALNRDGIYQYLQLLTIEDDAEPIINAPETFIVSTSRSQDAFGNLLTCEGIDSFTVTASDVCGMAELSGELQWDIRIRNFVFLPVPDENGESNYSFTGNSATINTRLGQEGISYFVSIDVRDACGNRASHTTVIEFEDITPPVAACQTESAIIAINDSIPNTIEASSFDLGSSDNCTVDNSLRFSIVSPGEEPINPRSVNFGTQRSIDISCANFESIQTMDVWVWDLNFNGTPCTVNFNYDLQCDGIMVDTSAAIISGMARTASGQTIPEVQISLNSNSANGIYPRIVRTDENGAFSFVNNERLQDYQLTGSFDGGILNGVSTLDLVLIQKHILGLEVFQDPYQVIASDADASGGVSVSDIITFRNVIVGNMPRFPNNNSWVVIPDGQTFIDPLSPWPFLTEINIESIEGNLSGQDFVAIKVGDVNFSADVNGFSKSEIRQGESLDVSLEDREVAAGEEFTVSLSLAEAKELFGFQFELQHPELELLDINASFPWDNSNARIATGHSVFSWNDDMALDADAFDLELTFKSSASSSLSSLLEINQAGLSAEAYQGEDIVIHGLDLEFVNVTNSLLVGQNQPNPFSDMTQIDIHIPAAGVVGIAVYDVTGKMVYKRDHTLDKGKQTIQLDADQLNGDGLMYYHIRYDDQLEVRKMILLK